MVQMNRVLLPCEVSGAGIVAFSAEAAASVAEGGSERGSASKFVPAEIVFDVIATVFENGHTSLLGVEIVER